MQHILLKQVSLKNHPNLNERWVHSVIEDDPALSSFCSRQVQLNV